MAVHYTQELFKAVYGLKQALQAWNKLLASELEAAGWVQSYVDPSLYLRHNDDDCTHHGSVDVNVFYQ